MRSLVGAILAVSLASCAFYRQNPPLQQYDPFYGYRFSSLIPENPTQPSPSFIIVSLSGGGTRAAALAYGALARMNQDQIGNGRTLLDKVDVISSVSGGSFASAYLGVFGKDRFINQFRDDVLYRQIQRDVIVRLNRAMELARVDALWAQRYRGELLQFGNFRAPDLIRVFRAGGHT